MSCPFLTNVQAKTAHIRSLPPAGIHVQWRTANWASQTGRRSGIRRPCDPGTPTCHSSSAGLTAAAPENVPVSTSEPASAVLAAAAKTQLLCCELGGGSGDVLWLEVVRSKQGRVEVLCSGELLQLSIDAAGQAIASPAGFLPRLGDAWVKGTPGLQDSLKKVRQQQAADGSLPSQLIATHGIEQLQPLQTLAQFQAGVAAAPGPWCDGTAPDDPPLTPQQQVMLTAGELAAFLAGHRGVCLLQLHKGWGDQGASMQPLLRPWVLALLQQAAQHKGVTLLASAAPEQLGASLVLCSRQQPFHAWGKHLASQGVQSSIVASSEFYKLLIGKILGYKTENIYHHIRSTGGSVTEAVVQAVDAELAGLSSTPAKLPWSTGGRRR